jgi:hypothetical protein
MVRKNGIFVVVNRYRREVNCTGVLARTYFGLASLEAERNSVKSGS